MTIPARWGISTLGFITEAFRAVQRNLFALFIYVVVAVGVNTLWLVGRSLLFGEIDDDTNKALLHGVEFGAELVLAVAFSVAQSIAFARIGAEMDKPLWKVTTDSEALKRFFSLWLLLNLICFAIVRFHVQVATVSDDPNLAGPLFVLYLMALVVVVPIGACVMFQGRFGGHEVGRSFQILLNQLPRTVALLFFNFLIIVFILSAAQTKEFPKWAFPLLDVISVYADCIVFAGAWLICMHDRQEREDEDGSLF